MRRDITITEKTVINANKLYKLLEENARLSCELNSKNKEIEDLEDRLYEIEDYLIEKNMFTKNYHSLKGNFADYLLMRSYGIHDYQLIKKCEQKYGEDWERETESV